MEFKLWRIVFYLFACNFNLLFSQTFVSKSLESGLSVVSNTEGVAVADYDLDGDLDIYFVAKPIYDSTDVSTWNRFFINNGNGTFQDNTADAGLQFRRSIHKKLIRYQLGISWGDLNNDGYPDLYLTNDGPDELYLNQQNGTFRNISEILEGGQEFDKASTSSVWWDYDLDGDLDLYVSVISGMNKMYENVDGQYLADVSNLTGLGDSGATWVSLPIDANNDGLLDLYVVNEAGNSSFYMNQGNKKFSKATTAFGLDDFGDGMGIACGDYNNDGLFDMYVTNLTGTPLSSETNPLFMNTGQGYFENRAAVMGVEIAGVGWGTEFFDFDHDGDEDLYVARGMDPVDNSNFFFENIDGSSFADISIQSGTAENEASRGLVVFDYDNDNDLDILVSHYGGSPTLYDNQTITMNWLKVVLIGTVSNRNGFGSVIEVETRGKKYYRYQNGVDYLGQSIKPIHFGLADAQSIEKITVRWPSGKTSLLANETVNRTITITEDEDTPTSIEKFPEILNRGFQIIGNYPNPFNGSTTIEFNLFEAGVVALIITDVLGQEIKGFTRRFTNAGHQQISWDGTNEVNTEVSSGPYFYKVMFGNSAQIGKMLYIK